MEQHDKVAIEEPKINMEFKINQLFIGYFCACGSKT